MEVIRQVHDDQQQQHVQLTHGVTHINHIIIHQIHVQLVEIDIHVKHDDVVEQAQLQHVRKIVQNHDDVMHQFMEQHVQHQQQVQ